LAVVHHKISIIFLASLRICPKKAGMGFVVIDAAQPTIVCDLLLVFIVYVIELEILRVVSDSRLDIRGYHQTQRELTNLSFSSDSRRVTTLVTFERFSWVETSLNQHLQFYSIFIARLIPG
jgi:hypothetical protein